MAPDRGFSENTDAPELSAMTRRVLASLVRRATAGELDAVEELVALRQAVDVALPAAMRGAHDGPGHYSWTEVGQAIGITRQAARQRAIGE